MTATPIHSVTFESDFEFTDQEKAWMAEGARRAREQYEAASEYDRSQSGADFTFERDDLTSLAGFGFNSFDDMDGGTAFDDFELPFVDAAHAPLALEPIDAQERVSASERAAQLAIAIASEFDLDRDYHRVLARIFVDRGWSGATLDAIRGLLELEVEAPVLDLADQVRAHWCESPIYHCARLVTRGARNSRLRRERRSDYVLPWKMAVALVQRNPEIVDLESAVRYLDEAFDLWRDADCRCDLGEGRTSASTFLEYLRGLIASARSEGFLSPLV